MFVYLLILLLANTCSYSFGNPVINTSETSPPLSAVLTDLADSCSSRPISSFIKSKVKECSVSPSFADKKQFGCLLLLDISSQLCNAAAANQVDIQSAKLDKINEFVDVANFCTVAKTWNASILSQDLKYNETIDEMFKNKFVCARVCGVEEITSQDSNIFCKFYKWGTEMLAYGTNQPVTAQGRINTTSGLPSGEGEADQATSNSRVKESDSRNEIAQPPEAPANLHPMNGNKPENFPGAARNPAIQKPEASGIEASNHAGVGANSGSLPLDSSPPKASENHSGAAGNPAILKPGASGNEASNHAGVGANSGSLPLNSSPPKASENHSGAARNPAVQKPGASGNAASNHAGVGANSGSLPLDSSPPKASENHSGAAGNAAIQKPGASGNEASNHARVGANSGSLPLDSSPPKESEIHPGAARDTENNNVGDIDYEEDQQPEDPADRNSGQSQSYNENDPVNVEETSGRLSSSVSKNRLGIDDDVDEDHFFSFFLTVIIMVVLLYILYHNKNKVSKVFFGLLVEGRQGRRRNSRGHAYRRLDTLEQAMSTNSAAPPSKIIY